MTAEQEQALKDAYPEFYRRALADAPPLPPEAVRAIRALLRHRPPGPVPGGLECVEWPGTGAA